MRFIKHCNHGGGFGMQCTDDPDLIVFFLTCSHFEEADVLCSCEPSLPSLVRIEKSLSLQSCHLNDEVRQSRGVKRGVVNV